MISLLGGIKKKGRAINFAPSYFFSYSEVTDTALWNADKE